MKKKNIVTNEELQNSLSLKIREMDSGTFDVQNTKTYISGVRALIVSVKLDVDVANKIGVPMFDRTKKFLGVKD